MPRTPAVHDADLHRFADDLRGLWLLAGKPDYRQLAERTHFGRTVLSQALNGRCLPTWGVTKALVVALGGDERDWRQRWAHLAARSISAAPGSAPAADDRHFGPTTPPDNGSPLEHDAPTTHGPTTPPDDADDRHFGPTTPPDNGSPLEHDAPTTDAIRVKPAAPADAPDEVATMGPPAHFKQTDGAESTRPGFDLPHKAAVVSVLAAIVAALVAFGGLMSESSTSPPSASDNRPGAQAGPTETCWTVTANDVRVFTEPRGQTIWSTWRVGTMFWGAQDGTVSTRLRVPLRNGSPGWVTNDPKFVRPSNSCG